jgi:hypothetical protein
MVNYNKYKYDLITVKVFSQYEFDKIQKLLLDNKFLWNYENSNEEKIILSGDFNTIYIILKRSSVYGDKSHFMLYGPGFSKPYASQFNYDKTIYTIIDYDKVKSIIIYGQILPSYKPKRIERSL